MHCVNTGNRTSVAGRISTATKTHQLALLRRVAKWMSHRHPALSDALLTLEEAGLLAVEQASHGNLVRLAITASVTQVQMNNILRGVEDPIANALLYNLLLKTIYIMELTGEETQVVFCGFEQPAQCNAGDLYS